MVPRACAGVSPRLPVYLSPCVPVCVDKPKGRGADKGNAETLNKYRDIVVTLLEENPKVPHLQAGGNRFRVGFLFP